MKLTIGYKEFHRNKFINYQLNGWYSLGYAEYRDLEQIGKKIKSFDDFIKQFQIASDIALKEGRLKNAATYLRASEFLIPPNDNRKIPIYEEFIELFDNAFKDEKFERHLIPYNGSFLSSIKIPSKTAETKGTINGIPGFDDFIEEFYSIWNYFTENGYDFIAFEGPGQGGSRRIYNQYFEHDYEKPTKALLNSFKLNDVTALGVSMGGYWIMRAAAFEKRITKVIAMPPDYDWLEMSNTLNVTLAKWFVKHKGSDQLFCKNENEYWHTEAHNKQLSFHPKTKQNLIRQWNGRWQ